MPADVFDEIDLPAQAGGDIFDEIEVEAPVVEQPQKLDEGLQFGGAASQLGITPDLIGGAVDLGGQLAKAAQRGWIQGEAAMEMQKATPNTARIAQLQQEAQQFAPSAEFQATWSDEATPEQSWEAFKKDPLGILGELVAESLGNQVKTGLSFVGKIPERATQGLVGGAAIGSLAPGVGTAAAGLTGAGVGALTGLAETGMLASTAAEYSGSILQSLQEEGVDVSNREQLEAAFQDQDKINRIKAKANQKAVPIGVVDGLLSTVGGRLFSSPAKRLLGKTAQWATELGFQAVGGAGGEAISQLTSEGEITSPRSIIAEAAAEPVTSIGEVALGAATQNLQAPKLAPPLDPKVSEIEAEIKLGAEILAPTTKSAPISSEVVVEEERFAPPISDENIEETPSPQQQGTATSEAGQDVAASQTPGAQVEAEVSTVTPQAQEAAAFDFDTALTNEINEGTLDKIAGRLNIPQQERADFAQDVSLKAVEGKDKFDPAKGNFRTWLNRVAERTWVDQQRREGAEKRGTQITGSTEEPITPGSEITTEQVLQAEDGFSPEDAVDFTKVQNLISFMPERDKEVFQSLMDGETLEQTGKRLGVSRQRAQVLRENALREIRSQLELNEDGSPLQTAASKILKTERQFADVASAITAVPVVKQPDIPVTWDEIRSDSPDVEKRWKKARVAKKPLLETIKGKYQSFKTSVTRPHFAQNLDPKTQGNLIEWMRQFLEVPAWARSYTQNLLSGLINPLGPKAYDVYSRNIILADLVRDIESGLYTGKSLPFGYKNEAEVRADLKKFQDIAAKFSEVRASLQNRRDLITSLRDELVRRNLLEEGVKDFDSYYRHQVLEYYNAEQRFGTGKRADRAKFGWQQARQGSAKDYNTDYLVAEAEYLSQAFAKIRAIDMLADLKNQADILPSLKQAAKASGRSWESLIPGGYAAWTPKPGNVFYWSKSLDERVLDDFFAGIGDILPEDVKETLTMGAKREQWVIPEGLAKDIDNLKPKDEGFVGNLAKAVNSGWKHWTLFNPLRAAKYNLNNLSGDFDALVAYDPMIVKEAPKVAKEIFPMFAGKRPFSPEILSLIQKGVINAGITAQEIENISQAKWFRFLKGQDFDLNLVRKYFDKIEDITNFREATFRVATYRRMLERLGKGDTGILAASDRDILNAIGSNEDKAARLSRELVGDYGAVSLFGKWMRERIYPFWSWKEINTKRYWRLFANAAAEGVDPKKLAASKALGMGARFATKVPLRVAQAGALYGVLNLWNHLLFPDEEAELSELDRRQLHLILGRDSEGNVQTLRVQGAFSDFLAWAGLEDFPEDATKLSEGKKTGEDQFREGWEAFVGQIVNGSLPIVKATGESLTGRSLYPNPLDPRPIRDPAAHMADLISAGQAYRKLAGIPQPERNLLTQFITYSSDPGEAAYNTTRGLVAEYLKKQGKEYGSGEPTERSNALYYYKQATRYNQGELAKKWLDRYYELGGTDKGLKVSIAKANPLGPLAKKKGEDREKRASRQAFLDTLSPEQKQTVERAEGWYRKVYQ